MIVALEPVPCDEACHVVLLIADDVIVERLPNTNNPDGKRLDQAARVRCLGTTVEPLLRKSSNHQINISSPLDHIVTSVLKAVGDRSP